MRQTLCLAALAVTACSQPAKVGEAAGASAKATASASDIVGVEVSEENDLYSFSFAYPAEAAAIPGLKAKFDEDRETSRSKLVAQAQEAKADATEMGFPYHPYAEGIEWKVVADTPRFLSLSAKFYTYTGGAHPNHGSSALVWDRETGNGLKPMALFTSLETLSEAVEQEYCAALNRQRAERNGEPIGSGGGMFSQCPKIGELTVLLGSSNGTSFDRIGLIADPYVAGSYAEGSYEVTLPVNAAILAAVRPGYSRYFNANP